MIKSETANRYMIDGVRVSVVLQQTIFRFATVFFCTTRKQLTFFLQIVTIKQLLRFFYCNKKKLVARATFQLIYRDVKFQISVANFVACVFIKWLIIAAVVVLQTARLY